MRKKSWLAAPDIPFAKDDANRFLPWIVAFMICLTGLMLAASLSLSDALERWNGAYLNSFTVQIPVHGDTPPIPAAEVVKMLEENSWVEEAREITPNEMRSLIEPWLGEGRELEHLPLPLLIEVRIRENYAVDTDALEKRLRTLAPGAEIDDYELWMTKFGEFSQVVQWIAFTLAACIIITTLGIVVLAAKTALRLHLQTVELLYTIGAQDHYIVQQFQRNAMWLVLKGALLGTLMASGLFWVLYRVTAAFESPLLPPMDFT
ncbi:MAG: cell division protein FtsX, partial [Rickettsiales bacterium]